MERAPVRPPASTTVWFPLVGAGIGAFLLLPGMVVGAVQGGGRGLLLEGALTLTLWTVLTGGLHEDGWADCADAALGPLSRERRLEVLEDPRIGAHGLTAVVLLLLVRLGGLIAGPGLLLVAAPVVGRWAMVLTLANAPALRTEGLGAAFASAARPWSASLMALLLLAALAAFTGPGALPAVLGGIAGGLAAGAAVAGFLVLRMGGLSGDGHGSAGIAAETGTLVGVALALPGLGG